MGPQDHNTDHVASMPTAQNLPTGNSGMAQYLPPEASSIRQDAGLKNAQNNSSGSALAGPLQMSSPSTASDSDLIEKEWVEAAKTIMRVNAADPFTQNNAMNLLRADYMKKRYNKDLKVSESS